MTTIDRQVRTVRSVEYRIDRGHYMGTFNKIYQFAAQEYMEKTGKGDLSDDWAQIDADDEHVIIRFVISDSKVESA